MPKRTTVLKRLLRQRHWQTYSTFCRQYDAAAGRIDAALVGHWPSRGQFARWLSGDIKGLPHPDHCRVLEAMIPGSSVRDLFQLVSAEESTAPAVPAARRPPRGLGLRRPGSTGAPGSERREPQPDGPPRVVDVREQRAHTAEPPFPHPGGAAAGTSAELLPPTPLPEEIAMTTEESARFVRAARGGVDHDVLDQLNADVRQLAVDYLVKPPLTLFRPLSQLRAEVFGMLDKRQRPTLLPPLYGVAGRLCALLAHASADLGHSYAAETHTRTAWLCADLADDDGLRAYVRWVQSNVAYWDGDYRQAAEIAHSGRRFATKGTNLLRLASQEARAWAAAGDRSEVERALAATMAARDQLTPDDQAGVFRFDPGKAAYYASEVRLALGGRHNAERAVDAAQESLRLFEEAPEAQRSPEFVAAARLDLANAHLALDDLEGAAVQLRDVLTLPVESRTQPIVGRVTSSGTTLKDQRFTRSGEAESLLEEITLFRAYPAQRDLPADNG